uniref:Nuclease HARBI1 n=1 Tax=Fagus sylvatica TaxID=28930 RepID=A0A2N9FRD0_FAGSY
MQHIVGKLSTSTFQRYKVCVNRSSDERVMAPGSRGAGAVFVCFSGEDSGQTGDATGEPRVARRSRSHYLSNAPGLAGQLAASRKDSAREGGCPGGKMHLPMSDFDVLGTVGKLALPTFARFQIRGNPSLDVCEIWFPRTEAAGVFLVHLRTVFRSRIPARPGKILAIREFHVVHECVFFPTCPGSRINLLRVRKTLRASVATSLPMSDFDDLGIVGKLVLPTSQRYRPCTEASLGFARYDLANRGRWNVPYAKGFDHNSLVSRPFLARKVSNRSSHHALQNGQGAVSSIQLLVWSTVRSNLGQTWSTLVKLGQNSPKLWEMCPGPRFEGFSAWWTLFGFRNGLVKPRSNLVNSGQTWSTLVKLGQILGNVSRTMFLRLFGVGIFVGSGRLGSGCLVLRADTRENPVSSTCSHFENRPVSEEESTATKARSSAIDPSVKKPPTATNTGDLIVKESLKLKNRWSGHSMDRHPIFDIIANDSSSSSDDEVEMILRFAIEGRTNAARRLGLSSFQKMIAAIRMLAYETTTDLYDEYVSIGETTAMKCVKKFVKTVVSNFSEEYLWSPTNNDIARLLALGESCGFPGMLGSIDCMHWKWKNCPTAWQGSHNDINVLERSSVFTELAEGRAPLVNYSINDCRRIQSTGLGSPGDWISPDLLIQSPGLVYQSPGSGKNSWVNVSVDWASFSHLDQGSNRLDP